MSCSFCDFYIFNSNKMMNVDNFNVKYEYSVALVEDRFIKIKDKGKKNKKEHMGRTQYYGYLLTYCPECGKRIKIN